MSRRRIAVAAVALAFVALATFVLGAGVHVPEPSARPNEEAGATSANDGLLAPPGSVDPEDSAIDEPSNARTSVVRGLASIEPREPGASNRSLLVLVVGEGGAAVAAAPVRVESANQEAIVGATDAEGTFLVAELSGTSTVRVERAGSFPVVVPFVGPGLLRVRLVPIIRLVGHVIGAEGGVAFAGARVRGMLPGTPARAADVLLETRTAADGAFAVDAPAVGPLRLVVDVSDGRRVEVPSAAPSFGPVWIVIPSGGRVEGRVRGTDGRPIRNARVFARRAPDTVIRGAAPGFVRGVEFGNAYSNSDGSYLIAGIEPGAEYSVRAEGNRGERSIEVPHVRLDVSGVARVNLALLPPVTIAIDLVDETGAIVRGARIAVEGQPYVTVTEPRGDQAAYRLEGVTPGARRIHVETSLGPPQDFTIEAASGANRVPVRIDAGVRVDGFTVDRKGLAVEGALVTIERGDVGDEKRESRTLRTGAGGEFAFGHLEPGPWRLLASAPGAALVEAMTVDAPRRGVKLVLVTLGRARIQLLREAGGTVEGDYEIRRTRGDGDVIHGSGTLKDGVVAIEGFDGQSETLEFVVDGYSPVVKEVRIPPEGETDLGVAILKKGHQLEGIVVGADGVGVQGVFVVVGHHGRTVTDRNGKWSFPGVPSGALTLLVVSEAHLNKSVEIEAATSGTFRIALDSGARVEGTVVGSDGTGIGGLPVSFTPIAGDRAGEIVERLRTDEDGTFDVRIPPGRYRIEAKGDGDGDAVLLADVTLTDGDARKPTLVYRAK